MASRLPAAAIVWPIIDLLEDTSRPPSPNTRASARASMRSFCGVPVPWALAYCTSRGAAPARARAADIARTIPSPSGSGAVTWKASVVMPWPASVAYTRAPRARARASDSSTMKPAPSPIDIPRRSRSKGRQGAGSRSFSALKPMKQMRVIASTPPATATSTTPSAISSAASASATAPELHAVTTVWRGPPSRKRLASVSACADGSIARTAESDAGRVPSRAWRQYHASASSIPPPTAPTTSAAAARSRAPSPASASASPAAPMARRSARVRRAEPASGSGTAAASRQRKPSVPMRVSSRIAQAPPASPFQ